MSKTIFKNYWISVHQTSKGFVYAQRRNINSTASLLYKKTNKSYKFLLRYQPLPELKAKSSKWNKLYPCCVTGSLEKNETPMQNAIKEISEETNYIVSKKQIVARGQNVSSTQMNELVYIFVVDITDAKYVQKNQGDGTIFENISVNKWVSYKKLKKIITTNVIYLSSLSSALILFQKYHRINDFPLLTHT